MWPFKPKPAAAPQPPEPPRGSFLTHLTGKAGFSRNMIAEAWKRVTDALPRAQGVAMDDSSTGYPLFKQMGRAEGLPDALVGWFVSQTFIGYHMCALVAQNWLVDKACTMPARDAIRHGFDIHVAGLPAADDPEADPEGDLVKEIRELDKKHRVHWNMEQFVRMGRVFGVRIVLFRVDGIDYSLPFNIDGVKPGAYKGMSQIDPYWVMPELDSLGATDPTNPHYYEPTWWTIQGKRYHRSHFAIFRCGELPDVLKPMYNYGSVSIPQRIMERVYAAERTANEGPQLAMTKRLTVWKTDVAALAVNQEQAATYMNMFTEYRDNHGVKVVDTDDTFEQHDTGLADLDATIMTQYQLVAASAAVPATKLLETTPKGFNSSGDYEEGSYHEGLETIQTNDLTPLLERHYACLLRSEIEPAQSLAPGTLSINIDWAPVDSPTAKEYAEINNLNAQTDNALIMAGAIDGTDVRDRLKTDKNSGYTGLPDVADADPTAEQIIAKALGNGSQETPAIQDPPNLGSPA